jgi:RNA polymerase sigma-70 factor, ECF subfamily
MGEGNGSQKIAELRPMLLRVARLQLRNEAWAEDAVSETIVAAMEGMAAFDYRSQLRTWVVGILKHKIIDQFRRGSREVSIDAQQEIDGGDDLEGLFDGTGHRISAPLEWGDPESSFARKEFFAVLQACVDQLPAPLARAFLLREWLEFDTVEICKEMKVTSTNCFVMLYRARLRLRECLESKWFAGEGSHQHG